MDHRAYAQMKNAGRSSSFIVIRSGVRDAKVEQKIRIVINQPKKANSNSIKHIGSCSGQVQEPFLTCAASLPLLPVL